MNKNTRLEFFPSTLAFQSILESTGGFLNHVKVFQISCLTMSRRRKEKEENRRKKKAHWLDRSTMTAGLTLLESPSEI